MTARDKPSEHPDDGAPLTESLDAILERRAVEVAELNAAQYPHLEADEPIADPVDADG